MPFTPASYPGVVHHVAKNITVFEHSPPSGVPAGENIVLWIGGLGDTLVSVPYPIRLSRSLPQTWTLAQVLLTSSGGGWGTASLRQDADELATAVAYFRERAQRAKIVLMGHSTGCQDAMEYLTGPGREERAEVQGVILQAPVSDREAIQMEMERTELEHSIEVAREWMRSGRAKEVLPTSVTRGMFGSPVSARRWLSLTSPDGDEGEDDYFSSDLADERLATTFGSIGRSRSALLLLFGGRDPYVPSHVDKEALVKRWSETVKRGGGVVDERHGGLVPGASHNLLGDPDEVVRDLIDRVLGFLRRVDEADFDAPQTRL